MNDSTKTACACKPCPGSSCRCGCQRAAATKACACGPACRCGGDCRCAPKR